jgi:MFS family permease
MRMSLALTGVVLLIIPLVRSFAVIVLLTFVWAFVADATRPASMAALTGSTPPEKRKAAIAVNRLGINLGMSIGPAVGGFLAMVSFPLLFVVDGLTSLGAAALLSALLYLRRRRGHTKGRMARADEVTPQMLFAKRAIVWRDRRVLAFLFAAFLLNLVFSQHMGAMPLYLVRDLHYRESFFGALFVLNTLVIVAIEVPLNIGMSHWPAWRANALAAVLIATGFGALAIARTPIPIAITVVIWTFGEMIFFPTATAYVAELAPRGRAGEYMGAFSATIAMATIVGPWAGTTLLDRFGAVPLWTTMLACGLAGSALLVWTRRIGVATSAARDLAS